MTALKSNLQKINPQTIKWILMLITLILFVMSAAAPGSPGEGSGIRSLTMYLH
jgi:hypothetical protein